MPAFGAPQVVFMLPGESAEIPTFREKNPFESNPRYAETQWDWMKAVNNWHFAMLNDISRNDAFDRAIQKALAGSATEPKLVLDVGTGSGLLALMAARAGGAETRVVGIEGNRDMALIAERVVRDNGFEGQIKVLHKRSNDFSRSELDAAARSLAKGRAKVVGTTEEALADVVVAELFGSALLGEGALYFIRDVRERLMRPGGTIVPAAGAQYVQARRRAARFEICPPCARLFCSVSLRKEPHYFTTFARDPQRKYKSAC
jgi:predicted RNA methylase